MAHTAAPRWVSTLVLSRPAPRQPPPPALRARATVAMLLLASLGGAFSGAFSGAFGGAPGLAFGARAPSSSVIPATVSQEPVAHEPVPQGISLLGRELLSQATTPEQAAAIEEARRALAAEPGDAEHVIALGRALSEVWRYREAIEIYARGIEQHPDEPLLYRHRGHRYISLRDFERAEADLERAASLAAGSPGKLGAGPTFDIWYHLGLARYLQGDFAGAAEAYLACRDAIAEGDDESMVAVSHWLYMSLRRAGRDAEAAAVLEPIHAGMTVDENRAYHELLRLYRGEVTVEQIHDPETATPLDLATTGYGVANWWLYGGEEAAARALFERIAEGPYWPAFGFIAAEVELAQLPQREQREGRNG